MPRSSARQFSSFRSLARKLSLPRSSARRLWSLARKLSTPRSSARKLSTSRRPSGPRRGWNSENYVETTELRRLRRGNAYAAYRLGWGIGINRPPHWRSSVQFNTQPNQYQFINWFINPHRVHQQIDWILAVSTIQILKSIGSQSFIYWFYAESFQFRF